MGNYIIQEDLRRRIGAVPLGNFCQGYTFEDLDSLLSDVIERAEGMVDAYLASRYSTPVTASGFVKEMALRAAELEIFGRQPGADVPARVRKNWDAAEELLSRIADGKSNLPGGASNASAASDTAAPMVSGSSSDYSSASRFG
jgi:phage gp36-like protein